MIRCRVNCTCACFSSDIVAQHHQRCTLIERVLQLHFVECFTVKGCQCVVVLALIALHATVNQLGCKNDCLVTEA